MEKETDTTSEKTERRKMRRSKNKDDPKPYNWSDVLIRFAQISGTFAGFCITFIVLAIGGKVSNVEMFSLGANYGQISVSLFGISAALFIFSSQRFLRAQEYNLWSLSSEYQKSIKKHRGPFTADQWEELLLKSEDKCWQCEEEGRHTYNGAVLIMIGGLFFAIASYDLVVAFIVAIAGYSLEALQIIR
jgi:hypothetical protein